MWLNGESDIAACIKSAWLEAAPELPFEPSETWRAAGFDSLRLMEFVLRLEQSLGVKISYDLLTEDTSAATILRALRAPKAVGCVAPGTIFLIPGVFGDEPSLANFRATLRTELRFETLALPDLDQPARFVFNLEATAGHLAAIITARQPVGPLRLAGYSFGGLVAHATAARLREMGRVLEFVGIIDGVLENPRHGGPIDPEAASLDLPGRSGRLGFLFRRREIDDLDHFIIEGLLRINAFELARRHFLRAAIRRDFHWGELHRRKLLTRMRGWAVFRSRPRKLDAPTVLFASADCERFGSIAEWRRLTPGLRVHKIPFGHTGIFEPAALALLNPVFRAALLDAASGSPAPFAMTQAA